jgi:type IV secretory pathway VirD2 relaxase
MREIAVGYAGLRTGRTFPVRALSVRASAGSASMPTVKTSTSPPRSTHGRPVSDERLWKFVVTPEHGASLDLQEHARDLVAHMQRDLGSRLEWVAVDHYNTDNPHVHLLVRGRDLDGRSLRIPRDYIASGIRRRSQELATQRLGLWPDREILAARAHAVERLQFTELDRILLSRADERGIVGYRGALRPPGPRRELYTHELRRLQFLEDAGLVEKIGARTWRLSPNLKSTPRQAQAYGDIIESRAEHWQHLSDPRVPLVITQLLVGGRIAGRLVGGGWSDRLTDRRYVLIEATDGRLHYLQQPPEGAWAVGPRQLRLSELVAMDNERYIDMHRERVRTTLRVIDSGPDIPGLFYRGNLLGYASGPNKQRHAIVDLGREVMAFPAPNLDIAAGREVRATSHHEDHNGRRRLVWQLANEERERQRERGRGREL